MNIPFNIWAAEASEWMGFSKKPIECFYKIDLGFFGSEMVGVAGWSNDAEGFVVTKLGLDATDDIYVFASENKKLVEAWISGTQVGATVSKKLRYAEKVT